MFNTNFNDAKSRLRIHIYSGNFEFASNTNRIEPNRIICRTNTEPNPTEFEQNVKYIQWESNSVIIRFKFGFKFGFDSGVLI